MARFKTFANGGSLLPTDLNSIEDDYELAFSSYKTVFSGMVCAALGTNLSPLQGYSYWGSGVAPATITFASANGLQNIGLFFLDPADYAVTGRTTYVRVKAEVAVNATAIGAGVSIVTALHRLTETAGATNVANSFASAAQVTSVLNAGTASTTSLVAGSDVALTTAGYHMITLGAQSSGASGCKVDATAQVQIRTV